MIMQSQWDDFRLRKLLAEGRKKKKQGQEQNKARNEMYKKIKEEKHTNKRRNKIKCKSN